MLDISSREDAGVEIIVASAIQHATDEWQSISPSDIGRKDVADEGRPR